PTGGQDPLRTDQLELIVSKAEEYVCEIFRRKCRVPFIVKNEFSSRGYTWEVLNQRLLMFKSSRAPNERFSTTILNHCSIFDPNYGPALRTFQLFIETTKSKYNYSLFIYDGELLPDNQIEEIAKGHRDVIILHHQELATLMASSLAILAKP